MKGTSWWLHKNPQQVWWRFFFTTPLLSLRSQPAKESSPHLIPKFLFIQLILLAAIFYGAPLLYPLNWWKTIILAPIVLILTESMSVFGQLLGRAFGSNIPPMHHTPLTARSLAEFWGKDWNRWVQDWLRDVGSVTRRWPLLMRLGFIFFISGSFHEIAINLPYWLTYGKSYFGTMMAYFLIQGIGLWIAKRFVYRAPIFVQRLYLWIVVILPSPLFVNTPILTFLGIKS